MTRFRALGCVIALMSFAGAFVSGGPASAATNDTHDAIQGSGSTWAANAINQWVADTASSNLTVVYNPVGSSAGRTDFSNSVTQYSDTDVAYGQTVDPTNQTTDTPGSRAFAYLPVVAGGTSFPYHLTVAGQMVTNLRLSPATLAKIFTNQISNWNDPAVTADNNGRQFPSIPIVPVVRSDGSGATAQFTLYLDKVEPQIWEPYFGQTGGTSFWPRKDPQIAQNGSDGVINYLTSSAGQGAIAFDEYSYALQKGYPVAKVENAAGYFTLPTQYNVAVALTQAQINTSDPTNYKTYLTQILDAVYTYNDPRTYPVSSYSYFIIPTGGPQAPPDDSKMTTGARQTLGDYLYYSLCQGQSEMGPLGYSPLPRNLVAASFSQVQKLQTADSMVNLTSRDITTCQNPTFDPSNPNANRLAEIAPQPADCDKVGAGPCGTTAAAVVNANPSTTTAAGGKPVAAAASKSTPAKGKTPTGATKGASAAAPGAAATTVSGAPGGTPITGAPAATVDPLTGAATSGAPGATVDPLTGAAVSADGSGATGATTSGSGSAAASYPTPTVLAAQRAGTPTKVLVPIIVLLLLLCLLIPPMFSRRRNGSGISSQ